MDGQRTDASHHTIFLGITIYDKLNWVDHSNNVRNKNSEVNDIINRLKFILPRETLLSLFKLLVYSHIIDNLQVAQTCLVSLNKLHHF